MSDTLLPQNSAWTLPQKILFRFFFIYFTLFTAPWDSVSIIPGIDWLLEKYNDAFSWAVVKANEHFFQVFGVKHVQQVFNGSGDTSYDWAVQCFILCIAAIGALVWSMIDWKRKSYRQLNYLLCLFLRYTLALIAFGYGIIKVFPLQMSFPLTSQLATSVGDLLPMRFSWLFIGYSTPYMFFSGVMEILVALLLLYRRTATLGTLIATAVFINVMMLNLCYDIPVKLFAMNIVLMCLYLLVNEWKRIACFFVLNRPAASCSVYDQPLTKKWMRVARIIIKLWVIFLIARSFYDTLQRYQETKIVKNHKDFKPGVYDVTTYVVNKDTIAPLMTDSLRWKDLIIENNGFGSINTSDTMFRRRYGRGYFAFEVDTLKPVISFKKNGQSPVLFSLNYLLPDSNTIRLWGKKQSDSVFIELKRSARHFQLEERQFHWLSEANR